MTRHGRPDDTEATHQHTFGDAFGGEPVDGRRKVGGAYDRIASQQDSNPRPTTRPDDEPTTVLHFEEGVFDGPPPHTAEDAGYGGYDDEYAGGYRYADRSGGYRAAEFTGGQSHDAVEDPYPAPDDAESDDSWRGDEREAPQPVGASQTRRAHDREAGARRKRGRVVGSLAVALLLVLAVGGGFFVYKKIAGPDLPPDFTGPAGPAVIVQVNSGETANEISVELVDKGVVASAAAFYNAAVQNAGMNAVRPGFYSLATNVAAVDAVAELVEPTSRVGALVVSEGRQLHDIRDVNTGAVRKGIYTLIAEASCYEDGGTARCLTYEELNEAGASTDLAALGVPEWARSAVTGVPDRDRQLEGLIAAGSWDFDPSVSASEVLARLVSASAEQYDRTGIADAAAKVGLSPYEMLVAASLVEREALPADFAKVARVILNRLEIDMPLQFDSTVNYSLDETELATTDADRARVTPWNTYASPGLPATPISSPSIGALQAVENPEPGTWIYFVTIDAQGTTLFADSYAEHLANTEQALESGILNSGR